MNIIQLDGKWRFLIDRDNKGKELQWQFGLSKDAEFLDVPSIWNIRYPDYTGVAWYEKTIEVPSDCKDKIVYLTFDAVNYLAEVWINGNHTGTFESGYLPFRIEITKHILFGEKNTLVVRVVSPPLCTENNFFQYLHIKTGEAIDGLKLEELPSAKQTMYATFGGIWQRAAIETKPQVHIDRCTVATDVKTGQVIITTRLLNLSSEKQSSSITLIIRFMDESLQEKCKHQIEVSIVPGKTDLTFCLQVDDYQLWSTDNPSLYQVQILLETPFGKDEYIDQFGFREFSIKKGTFFLNGESIFIKGVLFQPFYPITLAYPENEDILEKIIDYAKAAGFNLFRVHISPGLPKLLELCDKKGLMIYQEPSIGWIKDSPFMEKRCFDAVSRMLERDKNHPSIVMWGILNESGNFNYETGARRISDSLIRFAHDIDPTRLIVDDSGGVHWSGEFSKYFNPHSSDCNNYVDIHTYHSVPLNNDWFTYFKKLGDPNGRLNFVTEFGFGGLLDLEETLKIYKKRNLTQLQDYYPLEFVYTTVQEGIEKYGLVELFRTIKTFCFACQEIQATENARIIEALRANENVSGYCLTQFQDTSIEMGAGVVDYFYQPKKIFYELSAVQKDLVLVITTNKETYCAGEKINCEIILINELGIQQNGRFIITAYREDGDKFYETGYQICINSKRVQCLFNDTLTIPGVSGQFTLKVVLRIGEGVKSYELVKEHSISVFDEVDFSFLNTNLAIIENHDVFIKMLSDVGIASVNFDEQCNDKVIILPPLTNSLRAYPFHKIENAVEKTKGGATFIVFELPLDTHKVRENPFQRILGNNIKVSAAEGIFLGAFHWYKKSQFFKGIGEGGFMDRLFSRIYSILTISDIQGEFWAGSFTMWPNLLWGADLVTKSYGKGKILFCQMRILNNLKKDIVARTILKNILEYAFSQ